jgi:hypothetical protein
MTAQLIDRIQQLDDHTAIRILEHFAGQVFEGLETPVDVMVDGVVPEVKNTEFFNYALNLTETEQSQPLTTQQSAEVARMLLMYFAPDPVLGPALTLTFNEYKDDQLMVGAILATGVAVSMIIVAATTQLDGQIGGMRIKKGAATPKQIEALSKLIPSFPMIFGKNPHDS